MLFRSKQDGASRGIIPFGSCVPAIEEARYHLKEAGIISDFMRVRAVPFTAEVRDFIQEHERNYVVEQNRDGQLHKLLILECPDLATHLIPIAYTDGIPLTARLVREAILTYEEELR